MKILFALPGFHRFDRGAEVALLSVARALAARGDVSITVMGSGEPTTDLPYRYLRVPSISRERFEKFPTFPPLRNETAWEDATFAASLVKAYNPEVYDAVLTCSFPFTHWTLRRPALHKPLQVFVTQNGDWPAVSSAAEFRTFACDLLVCTNPDFFKRSQDRWNSVLIPNGVNLEQFRPGAPERERFGLPNDRPIILMVSAFIETKRVLAGIRALAELSEAHLVVAGDGPLREEAVALAADLIPGRFTRLSLSAADMPGLYRSADCFLHLSLLESFGNVFLEAWASGLPIVAQDTERLRWILGEKIDYLCDTENPDALHAALTAALIEDRPRSREGLQRFAWSHIAEQYYAAIKASIKNPLVD